MHINLVNVISYNYVSLALALMTAAPQVLQSRHGHFGGRLGWRAGADRREGRQEAATGCVALCFCHVPGGLGHALVSASIAR